MLHVRGADGGGEDVAVLSVSGPPPRLFLLAHLSLTCTFAEPRWQNLEVALSRLNGFAGVGFAPVDPPHLPVILNLGHRKLDLKKNSNSNNQCM